MSRGILIEYRLEIGIFLVLLFSVSCFIGLLGALLGPQLPGFWGNFQDLIDPLGNWIYWLAVMGPMGLTITLWWFSDYIIKSRKLKKLLETTSKAKFIKDLDDIEYLAWRLPKRYEVMVVKRKTELKIKR